MKPATWHTNRFCDASIYGSELEVGDIRQAGDVYEGSYGWLVTTRPGERLVGDQWHYIRLCSATPAFTHEEIEFVYALAILTSNPTVLSLLHKMAPDHPAISSREVQ